MMPETVLDMFVEYAACSWHFCMVGVVPIGADVKEMFPSSEDEKAYTERPVSQLPLIGGGLSTCVAIVDVSSGVPTVVPVGRLAAPSAHNGMMVRTTTHVCIVPSDSGEPMAILDTTVDGGEWQQLHSPVELGISQRAYVKDDSVCVTDIAADGSFLLDIDNQSATFEPLNPGYTLLDVVNRRACLIADDVQPPLPQVLFHMDSTMVVTTRGSNSFAVYLKDHMPRFDSSGKQLRSIEYQPLEKKWCPLTWPLAPRGMRAVHYDTYDETLYAVVVDNTGEVTVQAFRIAHGPTGQWAQLGLPLGRAPDNFECCVYLS